MEIYRSADPPRSILRAVPAGCTIVALVLPPLWLFATNSALPRAHPLLPGLLLAALLLGLVRAVVLVHRRRRPAAVSRRPRRHRPVLASLGSLLVIALLASLTWLAPFPLSDDSGRVDRGGLPALELPDGVRASEDITSITLVPAQGSTRGLVFYPGARVEALAYVPLLSRVAAAGTTVVVLKEPLGISLVHSDQALGVLEDHPGITTWAVGGHSLGGVSASIVAEGTGIDGLLLWASYPLGDLSGRELEVLSLNGSEDGLTTPEDVEASRALLPAAARYEQVVGAVHAYFGDYGEQPGDGRPGVGRAEAQERVVALTQEFLDRL